MATGKENLEMASATGTLAKMFHEGTELIGLQKSDNLFQQLDSRSLTDAEEKIIKERVELQRRMLAAYERQERARKVEEIRNIHPGVSEEEAEKALELCSNREEEAAARLAEPAFKRQVTSACKGVALAPQPVLRKTRTTRARKLEPAKPGDQVFVGSFRGRGYAPVPSSKSTLAAPTEIAEEATTDPSNNAEPELSEDKDGALDTEEANEVDDSADVGIYGDDEIQEAHHTETADEPQRYMLAKELSTGELRPATASEVDDIKLREASRAGKQALPTPPSVKSIKPEVASDKDAAVNSASVAGAVRLLARQSDEKALKFLQKMPCSVAARALMLLKEENPSREAVLSAGLSNGSGLLCSIPETAEEQPKKAEQLSEEAQTPGNLDTPVQIQGTSADAEDTTACIPSDATETDSAEEDAEPPVQPKLSRKRQKKTSDKEEKKPATAKPKKQKLKQATVEVAAKAQKAGTKSSGKGGKEAEAAAPGVVAKEETPSEEVAGLEAPEAQPADGAEPHIEAEPKAAVAGKSGGKAKANKHAISVTGHTNRGRVRQKSHKSAELVEVGSLRAQAGWYNAGYIFPEGFKSKVNFRSSVELDQLCVHECSILGKRGEYWPAPTFVVVAMDRPDEHLVAKSCTGCWTAVLKRINAEIEARRKAGENLPPPPKTAIAGPEYFGFNQAEIQDAVELLDSNHECTEYWRGKADREARTAGLPVDPASRPPKPRSASGPKARRKRNRESSSEDEIGEEDGEEEAALTTNKWSAVSRQQRYRKRCGNEGDANYVDADNPLPGWMDPITLEPVASPAISPWGHVMGMATWKAILSSSGKCPFTQRKLSWEQCQLLTTRNIARLKDRIVADDDVLKKFGLR